MKLGNGQQPTGNSWKSKVIGFALCAVILAPCRPVHAQVANKIPRIGYLTLQSKPNASEDAFIQGLRDLGYIDGQTITIECGGQQKRSSVCLRLRKSWCD